MGVGELAGEIPNQFEINSEEVKIEKLAITDRIKLSQIMANDSDGILLENFAFQGNTIYSLTPSTTEGGVDKVYPYNPYRLIKRFMYSLITTDSSQMQQDGVKRYYLDLIILKPYLCS